MRETPDNVMSQAESRDEQPTDAAILCAVAAGATIADLARRIDADAPDDAAACRAIATLTRRGLLHAPGEAFPRLTRQGRAMALAQIGAWTASAAAVEEERQQVERLRTDLLSTISHELRTPLTLIRTSIGLLLDSNPDAEMQQRLLRNIKQSTDRMHLLVADLLDLARMRGDRFDLQVRSVDLGELVLGAVSLMRPLSDENAQQIDIALPAPPPVIPGDYRRLERVLLNLLGNAIKFARAGSSIAVTVSEDPRDVTVAIRDSGPGIPAEALPHLFDQFFTARTSSTSHNIGAGLGLPIAKGIVEAHGGRIWIESTVEGGTTVSFTVPRSGVQEERDEGAGDR
jgi:signal transduction histidine kinase